ncbi:MAG: TIGR00730 family Rossman fold protein [Deltaproteobacteria bacterium]|nr:TIGR00730 family Rossman fold protein [Deltaproteobacteria bacterium]
MPSNPTDRSALHEALLGRLAAAHRGHQDPRAGALLESLVEDAIGLVADATEVADLKLVTAAFAEIRAALAMFRPYPGARKVTAFGSARTPPDDPAYLLACEFGRKLAAAGFMVITGGGPGIMGAALEGAGRENGFGVGIRLPFEQQPNATLHGDRKLIEFKYFFTRKLFFLKEASAVALFPGGFGTHDEGFETLTLVQTGKSRMVPVVCLDVPGGTYWKAWDRYVREHLLKTGMISQPDLSLYRITDNVDEAVEEITRFYSVYHSMRTIRRRTVLRLTRPLRAEALEILAGEFADILGPAPIRTTRPYKEENDEPATALLPRIVFDFDQRSFGRLRQMVDRVNELGRDSRPKQRRWPKPT